jgi:hypothetical protein
MHAWSVMKGDKRLYKTRMRTEAGVFSVHHIQHTKEKKQDTLGDALCHFNPPPHHAVTFHNAFLSNPTHALL